MSMTKVVFLAVIAILAAVLYTIPSHAGDNDKYENGHGAASPGASATPSGAPEPGAVAPQNSNGQGQAPRKTGQERAATRKQTKDKSSVVPPAEQPK
jgi:hypothetical protein